MANKINLYILCSGDIEMNIKMNNVLFKTLFSKIHNVVFVDVKINQSNLIQSPIIYSHNYKTISVKTISELAKLLKKECVILSLLSHNPRDWIVFFMAKIYKRKIVYQNLLGEIVKVSPHLSSSSFINNIMRKFKLLILLNYLYAILTKLGILQKIDTLYTTERSAKAKYQNNKSYNRVKLINSKFYDALIENQNPATEEYIVFLDSMVPYHGDQIRMGFEPMDANYYFHHLNLLFALLEELTLKKVVVCLHPKYDEKNLIKDFPNNLAVKNESDKYIPKASLVLCHETTLINYAVVYNKKIIQLTSKKFNDFLSENIKSWFDTLGIPQLEFDSNLNKNQINEILQKKVKNMQQNYLSTSIIASGLEGELGSDQIVLDLKEHYGIE